MSELPIELARFISARTRTEVVVFRQVYDHHGQLGDSLLLDRYIDGEQKPGHTLETLPDGVTPVAGEPGRYPSSVELEAFPTVGRTLGLPIRGSFASDVEQRREVIRNVPVVGLGLLALGGAAVLFGTMTC